MKKIIVAILSGMILGLALVVGVFAMLHVKNGKDDVFAQSIMETIGWVDEDTEEEFVFDDEEQEEADFETEAESEIIEGEVEVEAESETAGAEIETEEEAETTESGIETEVESEIAVEVETQAQPESEKQKSDAPYYIMVNRTANCVTVYEKDANGEYTVPVKAMVCSVGLNNKTPLGTGKISDKYEWRLLFGDVYGQYAVRFDGHIMFHSVPYTTTSKDALKEGEYNLLGQPASKGCVRLSVADAKWIYDNCKKGTLVEVYESEDPGPLGKPSAIYIDPYHFYRGWDPTDPDPLNPWQLYGFVQAMDSERPAA